jgi:hypothetical protein
MTRAWVVYESMFGNTRQVAEAITEGLRAGKVDVALYEVGHAPTSAAGVDLLVVGAPTHALGLSRPSTREDAAHKSGRAVESSTTGLREWMDAVDLGGTPPRVVAFDTRVDHPRFPGSAAKKAAKHLRRRGAPEALRPESFWVHGTEGPLADGEEERAQELGSRIAASVA